MQLFHLPSPVKIFIVSSVVFVACGKQKAPVKTADKAAIVDVIIAQPKKIDNIVEANGTVVANEYVELHPEVSGRITYLDVPEGDYIKQGTLIARVNDEDLEAQLDKSKVELDLAQKTVARYKQLLAVNGINQSDYDAALNTMQGYQADIEYEQALINKTFIKAPFDGIVGLRQISMGAYVTPADVIATIQQVSKVKVDFTIPEEYSNIIKKGATVDVELDAATKRKGKALIIAVEPQANTDTRNLTVRALLEDGTANAGSFVKVLVNAASLNAIMVPTNAIIPDDRNNQMVLVKNGKATFVNVQTGVRQANNVEITKGIQTGDSVVVSGVLFARPNSAVKVRHIETLQTSSGADTTGN